MAAEVGPRSMASHKDKRLFTFAAQKSSTGEYNLSNEQSQAYKPLSAAGREDLCDCAWGAIAYLCTSGLFSGS